jgi:hypothetical protein
VVSLLELNGSENLPEKEVDFLNLMGNFRKTVGVRSFI